MRFSLHPSHTTEFPTLRARDRALLLAGTGAAAAAAFGAMAVASAKQATVEPDNRLHGAMAEHMEGPAAEAAVAASPAVESAGKWWIYAPAALAVAAAVLAAPGRTRHTRRGRRAGAAAIAAVPAIATALSPAFDRWLPQPPVGPRRRPVDHPVFPSGHAFRLAAVTLATGYVVTREEIAGPASTWSAAVATPAVVGLGRLIREKHLASDVLGGWLAGIALAAAAASAYEVARGDARPRRGPARRKRRG